MSALQPMPGFIQIQLSGAQEQIQNKESDTVQTISMQCGNMENNIFKFMRQCYYCAGKTCSSSKSFLNMEPNIIKYVSFLYPSLLLSFSSLF